MRQTIAARYDRALGILVRGLLRAELGAGTRRAVERVDAVMRGWVSDPGTRHRIQASECAGAHSACARERISRRKRRPARTVG
jgi:hypothetical protein